LNALFDMLTTLKVPKKSKEYVQKFVRTMFFTRLERGNEIVIDGEVYTITMQSNVGNYECRSALFEVASLFTDDRLSMECQYDTYT